MDAMELLHVLYINIVCILKIYVKFALITLVIYFIAEWYIVRYGDELEAELDAQVAQGAAAEERPASNRAERPKD
ncbi:GH15284 [Drosophila grimshawi]|uniref:GH15284 n=1 Tax=Drosophila grimshawi TaxID=7222 RepID=B4IWS1_DROGR|nr:GH15284 [Drosophila grimshawi]